MKRSTIIVGVIIVIAVIFVGLQVFYDGSSGQPTNTTQETKDDGGTSKKFDKAPDFQLKDYNGNEVRLSDFQGKVAVVNSWAVWCPFCRDELDDFGALQEEFKDTIVVIAIDRAESLEKAKGFTDSLGVTDKMVFLLDPRDSFYQSIGGFSMPETIFVDKEGNIRIHKRGVMELSEMRERVLSILETE